MSAVVMCDECGSVLLRSMCIHCVDAVLKNGKMVYGADICSCCRDKYDFPYDVYGVHAKPKESEAPNEFDISIETIGANESGVGE